MKEGTSVVCGSPKQHCLWGQGRRKMWLGKVAPALKTMVVLHGRKNQNQKTIPKHVKLEEESVQSSLVPKGTSWQIGMDHCKFLPPPGLWFSTSLSFCHSMIFGPEFIPILLSLSKAMTLICMFSLILVYTLPSCCLQDWSLTLCLGCFYSCVVKNCQRIVWAALFWRMEKPCCPVESQHGVASQWKRHTALMNLWLTVKLCTFNYFKHLRLPVVHLVTEI